MSNKFTEKVTKMSFEEALAELEKIVTKLENGNVLLDEAVDNYEYGNYLRVHCEKKLQNAKLKVEKIVKKDDNITTEPVDIE